MDLFQALILAVVEGVTEFLPISSTGHLVLTAEILNIPQTDFVKSFEIIIQLGAILAIVFLYWKKILDSKKIWKNVFVAFIPTSIVGFTLYKIIKDFLIGNTIITLLALFLGGVILIIIELIWKEKEHYINNVENLNYKQSFLIGLAQSISIIPGVSRAAASIIGGMLLGLKRQTAVEFSFLLAIPTMLGATGLDLIKSNFQYSTYEFLALAVGFLGSFLTALIVVKWFLRYIQSNNFILFGVYRIIITIIFWLIILK